LDGISEKFTIAQLPNIRNAKRTGQRIVLRMSVPLPAVSRCFMD
jgi:hypothetical protein